MRGSWTVKLKLSHLAPRQGRLTHSGLQQKPNEDSAGKERRQSYSSKGKMVLMGTRTASTGLRSNTPAEGRCRVSARGSPVGGRGRVNGNDV